MAYVDVCNEIGISLKAIFCDRHLKIYIFLCLLLWYAPLDNQFFPLPFSVNLMVYLQSLGYRNISKVDPFKLSLLVP